MQRELIALWQQQGYTSLLVTHDIEEALLLCERALVMSPRPGRIIDVIDCDFGAERTLDIRESPEFLKVAHRVREGLRAGHSYDE
ncbi:MAG: ABC transporter ATP-binding protein, partial [Bradyrhizobium sp.]|nr:ABC transporter ATP-binding protein [Bradyrhizobium sp.]